VRRTLFLTAAGLGVSALLALAAPAGAKDPVKPPLPGPEPLLTDKPKASCSRHGTTIDFFKTPKEAAEQAKKDENLVFVLHLSGIFEDPKLT
jgi:hypothetical protein